MKKILIAGEADKTINYENALRELTKIKGVTGETALHVPDITEYDGLILPGGGDIDPQLFGQLCTDETRSFDPALDRIQLTILKAFFLDHKPVLGICKGMQLINIFFGGDMYQHLETAGAHEYKTADVHANYRVVGDQYHNTTIKSGSWLAELYGTRMVVNSAHHQGVNVPGRGIEYCQFAEDGVTEALNHSFLPIWGTQWHPERLYSQDACSGEILLRWFVSMICG